MKDGIWLDWEDDGDCKTGEVASVPCGLGQQLQRKDCERSLGGEYCRDEADREVRKDVLYKQSQCSAGDCPGWTLKLFSSILS